MILGTAGHIDHGKTALVHALTGVDTDRLPEEKRRGITIDLGFAPLRLANGQVVGVVDVPGHEAFVRTMLAGASGIDVALLVIAADEGPMPQTREHLAILELLNVPKVIVALTKCDLVDADWLALVTEEVRELLTKTPYAAAEIIPASIVSGEGMERLRNVLALLAESRELTRAEGAAENDLFRLPVDRAFTVKGTGTVVTGTVWSGELAVDDTVRIMPLGTSARVRGLHSHGAAIRRILPGQRAAVALAGIEATEVGRGATLVTSATWDATRIVRADLTLLPDGPELRPRTTVRFHVATSDVGARVVAVGSPVAPGSSRAVRIVFDEPVTARSGDRFVLRSASPLATIGGGVITDSNAPRRARPMPALELPLSDRLLLMVTETGQHGMTDATIAIRAGVVPAAVAQVVSVTKEIARVGERWYAASVLDDARARVMVMVESHLAEHPLSTGAPRPEIRSRLGVEQALFDQIVTSLVAANRLEATGAELRTPGWAPALSNQQQHATDALVAALESSGTEPPTVTELQERFGPQTLSLLRHLERAGHVVQVEDSRYYAPAAVRELLRRLEGRMAGGEALAPTDLREVLGVSRKYLIPFLEYCDKRGYTARQGNGRVWRGAKLSS